MYTNIYIYIYISKAQQSCVPATALGACSQVNWVCEPEILIFRDPGYEILIFRGPGPTGPTFP